jgi:hypothetical protein
MEKIKKIRLGLLIIGFSVSVLIILLTSITTTIVSQGFTNFILTVAFSAVISGVTALQIEKTSPYKKELRKEILDFSIHSCFSFIFGIFFLAFNFRLWSFLSFLFFFMGLGIFLLTLIFERLDIYEPLANLLKK